ncbi:GIN domain-containing protein [Massilia sp. GCM10023247]|uniref:GIN domain-containing protein n=1 Tax=Massilia sp. GCM10023247 TaxID=3252643 RepID=UPI003606147F
MNNLFRTTLLATALTLTAGAALAADIVRETRTVDARVTRVKLDGVVDLVVRQGGSPSLVLAGERDDIARVTTRQRGETLEIDTERRNNWNAGKRNPRLRAELTVPNLTEFVSEGVGASTVSGFGGDKIVLALDGAGSVTLAGNYRHIDARLGGAGSLTIDAAKAERMDLALRGAGQMAVTGQTRTLHATLAGVGNLDAEKLRAEIVDLDMSGLGGATVHASAAVDVNLSGMGSATVYGKPARRNATTGGLGRVNWR